MAGFVIRGFRGMRPILDPKLLDAADAQEAKDVRLYSGAIEPVKNNETAVALKSSGTVQTIHRIRDNVDETLNWFEFTSDVDVVKSPITGDDYGRVYWTGDGVPKYAPETLSFQSGSGAYPRGYYNLGIPKPTVTPVASGSAVLDPATTNRYYKVTYYNATSGKESAPSDEEVTKALTTYIDNGVLQTSAFTADTASAHIVEFSAPHNLRAGDFIGITGSTVTGWNASWEVDSVENVKKIKIKNTQTFPSSAPAGSYIVKKRYLPTAELLSLPDDDSNADVTHKRVYRRVGSTWHLLTTLTLETTEHTDNLTDTEVAALPAIASSILTVPGRPVASPIATVSFDDTSITDNPSATTVDRLYGYSYVDASGNEGPISLSSGVVTVIDGTTEIRISTASPAPTTAVKKRIYRQNIVYASGTYTVDETQYKLLKEIPVSQDVYIDTDTQASIASNAAPTNPDAFDAPETTFAAVGKIPPVVEAESRVYVYTYVSEYGEEGPPSDPSTLVDIDPLETVTVTMGTAPSGAYNITKKYIYRTSTGSNATDYQFVAEVPVANTSYSDLVRQPDLGEVIPAIQWEAPPSDMKGLTSMANGIFVGFSGRDVCFSEAFMPHAWNSLNRLTVDEDIVGIGAYGQSVVVLTESFPYMISGIDPAAMSMQKMSLQQACVSKRSIVEMGNGVMYASPDGLVMVGSGGVQMLTSKIISQDQWQAYKPESIHAYIHEGRYHAFYNTGSVSGEMVFTLDGSDAIMAVSSQTTTAGHVVPTADSLYIVEGSNIVKMDKASTKKTYSWKSKVYENKQPLNFSVGQVIADSYSSALTMKVYADGSLKHTQTVTNDKPFRLPSGFIARDWYVVLEGTAKITMAAIAQSSSELKSV